MSRPGEESANPPHGRLREIEYTGSNGAVMIIQDTENDRAWLQSTVTLEVRR